MKTLILILAVTSIYAQKECYQYVSFGSDVKFATKDLIFNAGCVGNNFEMNIGYEVFKEINFDKYTIGIAYHIPRYISNTKTIIVPSIEPTMINRWGDWGGGLDNRNQRSNHLSFGFNLALRAELTNRIMLEIQSNYLPRIDLNTMYGGTNNRMSNYFKILYKL